MNNNVKILEDYQIEYLRDESRRVESADTISFPKTQNEVIKRVQPTYMKIGHILEYVNCPPVK